MPTTCRCTAKKPFFGRAGVETARSTGAQWVGSCGVELQPLVDALNRDNLGRRVVHADETPVQMLQPRNGAKAKSNESRCVDTYLLKGARKRKSSGDG
jgi:hypothetical protein